MGRLFKRLVWVAISGGIVWAAVFLSSSAFGAKWREFVMEKMAERGIYLHFRKLSVDPFRGLVARDVQVFNDENKKQLVAAVDRISLDFDLGKLLRGEVGVDALDLAETSLSLPVDPDHPELDVVNIRDVTARIFLLGDRLDIRRAEGELSGIRLSVTGSLILPQPEEDEQKRRKEREESAARRLKFIRDNREQIQKTLQWLSRFEIAQKPRIQIAVNGEVEKPQEMDARLTLSARGLGYGGYECREIEAQAEYSAGFFDLTRLYMRDRLGTLDASGGWQAGGSEVHFRLSTSADLHGLASAFLSSDLLKEVVFYESPNLSMDGTWYVGGDKGAAARPLRVLGRLQCGRFTSRGEIFDGLSANFGVDPAGFYVRDGMLRHKTGTLGFQAMKHDDDGLRYRATLKMDPSVFLPFIENDGTREIIHRFSFKESSGVFARIEGVADEEHGVPHKTTGQAELRSFSYKGVEFDSADGNMEIAGPVQVFRAISARRHDETVTADEVYVDNKSHWVRLDGVNGTLDPAVMMGCFAPAVASYISRYKLSNSTTVSVSGTVGWRDHLHNDLKAVFRDPDGTALYQLWGRDYRIGAPEGVVTYKASKLNYDVRGSVFGEPMTVKGDVNLAPGNKDYTVSLKVTRLPFPVVGRDLPFGDVSAGIVSKQETVAFDIGAKVFDGELTLAGTMDVAKKPSRYKGELRVNAASFRQFATTYSPGFETEGDLTGHFVFSGVESDWQKLKGSGVAIIVNGNLYAIPIIGPLTSMLNAVLLSPIKGYNIAKEANCTFTVADGFVVTDNFEALTPAFRIVSKGNVDFIKDDIDFEAQARMRGLPGIVLRPVSELLEYHGTGTIGKPQWHLNPFGIGGGKKEGQRPVPAAGGTADGEKPGTEAEKSRPSLLKRILPFGTGK